MRVPASSIHGFPRIGDHRELKVATEAFWAGKISVDELGAAGHRIRVANWSRIAAAGLELVPSNDFSFYDRVLDMTVLLNAVPGRYREVFADKTDRYFAMARGTQAGGIDLAALEMTKWFDTNYHYLVPELTRTMDFELADSKPLGELHEANELQIPTTPVLIGPITFLLAAKPAPDEDAFDCLELLPALLEVYEELLRRLAEAGATWVQLDEPALVQDRTQAELDAICTAYRRLGEVSGRPFLCVSTYFDHVGDALSALLNTAVEGIGLDFCAGPHNLALAELADGLDERVLFAGVVDGRNVWANRLDDSLVLLERLSELAQAVVVSSSCSLQHVPISLREERSVDGEVRAWLAFAEEKLAEIVLLARGLTQGREAISANLEADRQRLERRGRSTKTTASGVRARIAKLSATSGVRRSAYPERRRVQRDRLGLPLLPTTTIGSFPQTPELRAARAAVARGALSVEDYENRICREIDEVVALQERIGIDVVVHGEPERNDMVQYFAEQLDGFVTTSRGWVQSYGTRYTRPPIIIGDVSRPRPMTVRWTGHAQRRTDRPVKGMLTGPITMLLWSFGRDDLAPAESCRQIALAVRDEVDDLQMIGIPIVQVDEPAFREGLPLRTERRDTYLAWAAECFRLATAIAHDDTQIHTHMCYSEFDSILPALASFDVDVISFEAARSNMEIVDELRAENFDRDVGPGVYDIHSPRIPTTSELTKLLERAATVLAPDHLWVNPDCGLKTRTYHETQSALENLVEAAHQLRKRLIGQDSTSA